MAKIKHIEIAGRDGAALRDFYGDLFGWEIARRDVAGFDYYDIDLDPEGPGQVGAGIRHEPEGQAEVVVYVEVEDLDRAFERAQSLGGSVRIPPMEHGDLRFALIEDPEGNPVGLLQEPARPGGGPEG